MMEKGRSGMKTIRMIMVVFGTTLNVGLLYATRGLTKIDAMDDVDLAIRVYWGQHEKDSWGTYPASLEELAQFAYTHLDLGKPLLKKGDLLDAWGQPFAYETDGRDMYRLQSSGRDRVMGTADDRFRGWPSEYVDVARRKAEQTPAVVRQEMPAVQVATQTGGAASPSLQKRWFGKKDGAVPLSSREGGQDNEQSKTSLWLYAGISLCVLLPILYFLRRKLKTGNE